MQNDDNDGELRLVACGRDGRPAEQIASIPEAIAEACVATSRLYYQLGYEVPWIGYIATVGGEAIGGGAFVGPPIRNRVEIAYFTLPDREGLGFATRTAQKLVAIARAASPGLEIFAKTMPERNASTRILERLGFVLVGIENDHEIGTAWAWLLRPLHS